MHGWFIILSELDRHAYVYILLVGLGLGGRGMRCFTTPLLVCAVVLTGRGNIGVEVLKVAKYVCAQPIWDIREVLIGRSHVLSC